MKNSLRSNPFDQSRSVRTVPTCSTPGHAALLRGGVLALLLASPAALADWDVTIGGISSGGSFSGTNPLVWTPTGSGSTVAGIEIAEAIHAGISVVIQTSGGGAENGDIIVLPDFGTTGTGDLTLRTGPTGEVIFDAGARFANGGSGNVIIFSNVADYASPPDHSADVLLVGGTLTTYMWVNDVEDLQLMGFNPAGNYALSGDIDASDTSSWSGGDGFSPVGDWGSPFTGNFDGQGHVITRLMIHSTANTIGLFGATGEDAVIQRVGLVGVAIRGTDDVGSLVGFNEGTIRESYATGIVSGVQRNGGLVGYNSIFGSIENSYSSADVVGDSGGESIGGLVGYNAGSITNSYATGSISASSSAEVGGLVGETTSQGEVVDSYWDTGSTGQLTSDGGEGLTTAELMSDLPLYYWGEEAWGNAGNQTTPYLKALNHNAVHTVNDSANLHDVVQTLDQLQAMNQDLNGRYVLGNDIDASTTTTWNGGEGFEPVGGDPSVFSGHFDGLGHTISNLYINRDAIVGAGLFGRAGNGTLRNVGLLNADITGTTSVGALLGNGSGTVISHSYADGGSVTALTQGVGGLAGTGSFTIDHSYANVSVAAQSTMLNSMAGGLAGSGNFTISYSYATGSVFGMGPQVGGLVGQMNGGGISYSYATGAVSGPAGTGGLVGAQGFASTVISSYWDETSTGQPNSADLTGGSGNDGAGLTTEQWLISGPFGATPVDGAWDNAEWVEGNPHPGIKALPYITISADASQSYGAAATITTGSMLDQDGANASALVDIDNLAWNSAATATTAAGTTVAVAGSGATALGYQVLYAGSLTVAQAPLTITAADVNKIYDGLPHSGADLTYTGFVNGETPSVLTGVLAYAGIAEGAVDAGTYPIVPTGLAALNYDLTFVPAMLTIAPAPLSITANDASKVYDGAAYNGGNGVTYSGFVNGETEAVLGGTLTYGGSSQGAVASGTYAITPAGVTSGNYDLTFVNGTLSITAPPYVPPDEIVAPSGVSTTLNDLTPVVAQPGSILVIPPGANLEGISITLERPAGGGDTAPITFRIGSLTLTLNGYVDGTEVTFKQVLVGGVATLVLAIVDGELSLSGSAGQPLVTLNGSVVLSAAEDGSALRFSAPADGDGSGSIAVTSGRILIADEAAGLLVGDGVIHAGEVADFDATGEIVRLRLGSAPGTTGGVGDPLQLDLGAHLSFATAVPQLGGEVRRLGGSLPQALAELIDAELVGPQTDGVLVLDLGDRQLHALPVGDILIDVTRPDGVRTDADGLMSVAVGGVVVRFAPALPGLVELVRALPAGAMVTVRDGLLLADVGGVRHVVRPGWYAQPAEGAGLGETNGQLHYTWEGFRYALHAAFADYESVVDAVALQWPGALVFTNADGSVLIRQGDTSLLAVPARTAQADPDVGSTVLWWREADGTLYLRNTDGTVQAFELRPL